MFDTYSILVVVAVALSLISLKYPNLLFGLGGILGWIALWAYHQNNPPAGIIVGSFIHEALMYAYLVMAIAVFFMWVRNRQQGRTGYTMTRGEETELDERRARRRPAKGLLDLSPTEYRRYVRGTLRNRRMR